MVRTWHFQFCDPGSIPGGWIENPHAGNMGEKKKNVEKKKNGSKKLFKWNMIQVYSVII